MTVAAAGSLVAHDAVAHLHAMLTARGFELRPQARASVRADGRLSVRLVWRRRSDGQCVTQSLLVGRPALLVGRPALSVGRPE